MRKSTAIVLAALFLAFATAEAQRRADNFDGNWWIAANDAQRLGFTQGVFQCFVHDYGGTPLFGGNRSDDERVDRVTRYFEADSARRSEAALRVILAGSYGTPPPRRSSGDGEPGFNGYDWKEMGAYGDVHGQLAFVNGYLACYSHYFPRDGRKFAWPGDTFVSRISTWYRFDLATDSIDQARADSSIALVLRRVTRHPRSAGASRSH